MIIGLSIILGVAGVLIIGAGLIIREQLNRQDKRIDTLLAYIDPKAYRSKNVSEDLEGTVFRGHKKEIKDETAKHLSIP